MTKKDRIGVNLLKVLSKTLLPEAAPSCHASSLCFLPGTDGEKNRLLCAWFAGARESADDVEIWLSAGTEDADGLFTGWSEPVMMSRPTDEACWNPVLYAEGEHVTLFFKRSKKITSWKTFVRRSADGGRTWDEERELVPGDCSGGRGPVKDKPIPLSSGALLSGASHDSPDGKIWRAFFDRSEDGGSTWDRTEYLVPDPPARLIQPTLWEDEGGVHALLRSDAGRIYRADSQDDGKTWSAAYPTDLPNNNSGIDLARLPSPDGRLALACNPVASDWGARTPLTLFVSRDGGKSWFREADLERGPGEYSYPALIAAGGRLFCSFTWQRKRIAVAEIGV